ncbi:NAD(P)-binding protein [Leucogyrophana mollusca]|uniref:NAD(P)-binding protein n=1 Tax=Leucogyrophana mollusca TaxID=85980 RepID=A0ACB8BJC2_9AGAM|nr:NAD(P)-binding protein [Leucogyrophana mollusca]
MPTEATKVWFITGSSSGFGHCVAEVALQNGDSVVATLRKPDCLSDLAGMYPASKLLILPLDVTVPTEITHAFSKALDAFGRIDVVFNNAGFCVVSEAEGISDENARRMFEVDFWGAANITKEAVRIFRDVNKPMGGHLLQMSSRTGLQAAPGVAHYAAAKAALEFFSEGYAAELDPEWKIKITILEPALFRTPAPLNNVIEPPHPAYANPSLPTTKYRALFPGAASLFTGDPIKLAHLLCSKLVNMDDPPFRVPVHRVAIEAARKKGQSLISAADDYESWSDDIYLEEA